MLDSNFNPVQPAGVMKPPSTGLRAEKIHENTCAQHTSLIEESKKEKKRKEKKEKRKKGKGPTKLQMECTHCTSLQ